MARNGKPNNSNKTNGWDFLTKVFVAGLNKGQLPAVIIGICFIIICWRVPAEQFLPFLKELLNSPNFANILGWIGFVGSSSVSYYINRRQRRLHSNEIDRLSEEKKRLQIEASKHHLPSSNKKKRN